MFNPERLLGQMLSGALGGALGGRTARRRGGFASGNKAVMGVGLLGVAIAAWEHYSAQNAASRTATGTTQPVMPPPQPLMSAPPSLPPPPPAATAVAETRPVPMLDLRRQQALLLIRSMIAAAAADGAIDANERQAILDRASALGDDPEAMAFLSQELAAPGSMAQLLAQTPRSMADEVYAAAALAITIDTEQERAWLQQLAEGLGLDAARTASLQQQIGLG